MKVQFVLLLVIVLHSSAPNVSAQVTYPAREETTVDGVCLSNEQSQLVREEITQDTHTILQDQVLPTLDGYCGGTLGWHRVAFLNMTDTSQQCPDSWQLITSPKRTCGRGTTTAKSCDSVTFSTNNMEYNQVCGRAIGYQLGSPESFRGYHTGTDSPTLEGQYVDGLSVTHGPPGSREHIWTFAAGVTGSLSSNLVNKCPCIGGPDAPPFIANDYFCESGTADLSAGGTTFHPDDPLWDGQGCPAGNDCCSFSNPPWFTRQLDNPTNDNIEVRLCLFQDISIGNVPVELIELYIK